MPALPQFHNREQSFIQSKNITVCTNYDWPTIYFFVQSHGHELQCGLK